MSPLRLTVVFAPLLLVLAGAALADDDAPEKERPRHRTLVELFTSQG